MIQASPKSVNLGIKLKTFLTDPTKSSPKKKFDLPNEYFSNPFPGAFSNFTQQNFPLPSGKTPPGPPPPPKTRSIRKIKTLTFHNEINVHIAGDSTVYDH